MKNFVKLFGIIALVAVIGFSTIGCNMDADNGNSGTTDKFDNGIINGDWYLVDNSNNKTGSIITINGDSGILTTMGDDFLGNQGYSSGYEIGGAIIRNISYLGKRDGISDAIRWWNCESRISTAISGRGLTESEGYYAEQYLSYNTDSKKLIIYTLSDLMGYGFMK